MTRFSRSGTGSRTLLLAFAAVVLIASGFLAARLSRLPDYLQLANSAIRNGDEAAAIAALQSHLQHHPDATSVRFRIAALLQESRPEEAILHLEMVTPQDPQRVRALRQIAALSILLNRSADAQQTLLEIIKIEPQDFGAQLSLAELYFRNADPHAALPHALEAARLNPKRVQTLLLIAEIHDELMHPSEMIEPLQQAIDLEPDLYAAHLNLAYAFHKTGQLEEAEQEAKWCLQLNPAEVDALRILASVARDRGDFSEATLQLTAALAIQPRNLDCRILEADLLLYQRKPKEAFARLKEIFEENQTMVRYLGALARAATSAGEREEAKKHYQEAERLIELPRAVDQ